MSNKTPSINLKKLSAIFALAVGVVGGVGYLVQSSSEVEDSNAFVPTVRQRTRPVVPVIKTPAKLEIPSVVQASPPVSADLRIVDSPSASATAALAAAESIDTTEALLSPDLTEVLVRNPFATTLHSAAGEELQMQLELLAMRSDVAASLEKFLSKKLTIVELQQQIQESGGSISTFDEAATNDADAVSFSLEGPNSNLPSAPAESVSRATQLKLDNFFTSFEHSSTDYIPALEDEYNQEDSAAALLEPKELTPDIMILGIVSSSAGSSLLLDDGRRLSLRTGTNVDDLWKIQAIDLQPNEATITFETYDHEHTYQTSVQF